ncbi:MAG: hypothetical protein ACPG4X_15730 [Pikeienuella sp.]
MNQQVTVKPLDWGEQQDAPRLTAPGYHITAKSVLGVYRIDYFEPESVRNGPFLVTFPDGSCIKDVPNLETAQSIADDKNKLCVLSALTPAPVADPVMERDPTPDHYRVVKLIGAREQAAYKAGWKEGIAALRALSQEGK